MPTNIEIIPTTPSPPYITQKKATSDKEISVHSHVKVFHMKFLSPLRTPVFINPGRLKTLTRLRPVKLEHTRMRPLKKS